MKLYSPEATIAGLEAILAINMGNNGWAYIGHDPEVAEMVETAGYTVTHDATVGYRGYTQRAQAALRQEHEARQVAARRYDGIDYEERILRRDERAMMDY
jgi:hypothetical protein